MNNKQQNLITKHGRLEPWAGVARREVQNDHHRDSLAFEARRRRYNVYPPLRPGTPRNQSIRAHQSDVRAKVENPSTSKTDPYGQEVVQGFT